MIEQKIFQENIFHQSVTHVSETLIMNIGVMFLLTKPLSNKIDVYDKH